MKKKVFRNSLALLTAALIFGLLGCPNPADQPRSAEAELLGIVVGNQGNMLRQAIIGDPISQTIWETQGSMASLPSGQTGSILLANLINVEVSLDISPKARAVFTVGFNSNTVPLEEDFAYLSGNNVGFLEYQYFYVKVRSENGKVSNYYRFEVRKGQGGAILDEVMFNNITVSGNAAAGNALGLPSNDQNIASPGRVALTVAEAANVIITTALSSNSDNATVRYAKLAYDAAPGAEPVFGTADTFSFEDGDSLFIQVVSEDMQVSNYYKVEIKKGQDGAILDGVMFNNITVSGNAVAGDALGLPGNDENIASPGRVTLTAVEAESVTITAIPGLNSDNAIIRYAKVKGTAQPVFGTADTFVFEDEDSLFIQVVSENNKISSYYQVEIITGRIASLASVSIGGVVPLALGTPNNDWQLAAVVNILFTVPSQMTNALVEAVVTADSKAVLKYAKVTGTVAPVFSTTNTFTLAHLDYIYIEVTSANGNVINIYKFQALEEGAAPVAGEFLLTIGEVALEWAHRGNSHTGALTFNTANGTNMGKIFMTEAQMKNAVVEVIAGPGSTAKVQKGQITSGGISNTSVAVMGSSTWDTASNVIAASDFWGKDFVQVQFVTGTTTVYYSIFIKKIVNIPYVAQGAIIFTDATAESVWASAAEITIDRVYNPGTSNAAVISGGVDYTDPTTHAKIKLFWNEDGIFSLAEVLDSTYSVGRPNPYQEDSIEIYMGESFSLLANGNNTPTTGWRSTTNGGQYRSSRDGLLSADLTFNGGNNENAVAEIKNALGKGDGITDNGYIIKARYGWVNSPATVSTWVTSGKTISFDSQINYANTGENANGVLFWSNFLSSSYGNGGNHGIANLLPK